MTEFLIRLWSPVANVAGAVGGALAFHLRARFRRRMATLRWSSQTHAFALSGADAQHGTIEVLYNGEPAENVYAVTIQVSNDTATDLADLELQVGFRDGSWFLSASGQVRGSLRALELSPGFVETTTKYLAASEEDRLRIGLSS